MLEEPLALPCGVVLANRVVKAATSDGLGDGRGRATDAQVRLYRRWVDGGAGTVLVGEVQVDRAHRERPGNLVLDRDDGADLSDLRRLTGGGAGGRLWAQLSHPGALSTPLVGVSPVAPSRTRIGGRSARALTAAEISTLVDRFAAAATTARRTGFVGVEVHAAHGFLLSQFLSPRVNHRTDSWGGSLPRRARLLLDVVAAVRAAVGEDYPVAVKLNASDLRRGGLTPDDSRRVAGWLDAAGVDLLEISGGTYERGGPADAASARTGTGAREGCFLDFAATVRADTDLPLVATGGFRSESAMRQAITSGAVDAVGLARPLIRHPELPRRLLAADPACRPTGDVLADVPASARTSWYGVQLLRISAGFDADVTLDPAAAQRRYETHDHLLAHLAAPDPQGRPVQEAAHG